MLKDATKTIWRDDPVRKFIQQKLSAGPETIDYIILNNWDMGLEE